MEALGEVGYEAVRDCALLTAMGGHLRYVLARDELALLPPMSALGTSLLVLVRYPSRQ